MNAKKKLLNAAFAVIRTQGYSATTVDYLCKEAGVTKGAFFHHFKTKEELAVAAADHWSEVTTEFFKKAPYHANKDPLDRILGYVDFRRSILQGELPEFTCLVGTMVQETFETSSPIRKACERSIAGHAAELEKDIREAKRLYAPTAKWSVESLALYTQAAIQGAFILAKAKQSPKIAAECITHLRRYLELTFKQSN